ncbi:hypothetical protein F5Y16DRAFT_48952 [Xylariaceae sp. FL0255]|nr:hypothetical protein F5Y16DRAFT_48952 [Xylariaceae sp. FL0255]
MSENLDTTPALEPPPGVTPNFVNPPSIHHLQIAVALAALVVSAIAVAGRTFARAKLLKKFDLSDVALLLSLAIFTPYVALAIITGRYGQGSHQWNVPLSKFFQLLKIVNVLEILYSPLVFCAKYAVLRQIETTFFQHQYRSWSHKALVFLIWSNFIFYAAFFFSFIFACTPRSKIWNPEEPGRCIDNRAALISSSVINIVSDTTILILPLATIWKLQMSMKSKLQVGTVFAIGGLAITAGIVRLYYTVRLTGSQDTTYVVEPFGYWSEIEYASVILVACFPLLPLLFRHIANGGHKIFSRNTKTDNSLSASQQNDNFGQNSFTKLRHGGINDLESVRGIGMVNTKAHFVHDQSGPIVL